MAEVKDTGDVSNYEESMKRFEDRMAKQAKAEQEREAIEKAKKEAIDKSKLEEEKKKSSEIASLSVSPIPVAMKSQSEFNKDQEKKRNEEKKAIDVKKSKSIDKFKISYIEDYEEKEAIDLITECLGFEPPRMCGFNMVVKVFTRDEFTDGGIYIPDSAIQHDKFINCVGLVLYQGPLCYKGQFFEENIFQKAIRKIFGRWMSPTKLVPWCKVGDWVVFDRNAGPQIKYRGLPMTLIHDKHIRCVVPDPTYVERY